MYKVMRFYTDEFGATRQRYIGNREYKRLDVARMKADANKGGFVIRVGQLAPIAVGTWQ